MFVADLRHFLDMPDDVPGPARKMAEQLGFVVRAATAGEAGVPWAGRSKYAMRDMPVDILKIDKSFVDHLVSSPASARLVWMILQLAEDLGMRTVAEGAEDVAQVEILQTMGCRLIQGYYFSHPLPAPQLQELIRNGFVVPLCVANPKPPVGAGSGAQR
jgi:predicted signal transduction protein with EAL and GGDEF domain